MKIKYYEGENVEDLGLNMTVTEDQLGQYQEIDLLPNGSAISVNNDNKLIYVMHYANYMLNNRTKFQTHHFV